MDDSDDAMVTVWQLTIFQPFLTLNRTFLTNFRQLPTFPHYFRQFQTSSDVFQHISEKCPKMLENVGMARSGGPRIT